MKYYHAWFQTKYKKFILIEPIDSRVHEMFKEIAEEKKINLIASGSLPDHMHLLFGLEDNQPLSWAIKMFKGIASRKAFQEFPLLKEEFKTNNFWAKRYAAKEIPESALQRVRNYILNQKKDYYLE